ncbi:MAG: cytochrome c family protein [Proteobacteria bacterium]|nr:cytochrome c family protein [Pseudomonadota bacterium]MBU1688546.1 cytochrome c family protein [Pseudomonadota bacterium]
MEKRTKLALTVTLICGLASGLALAAGGLTVPTDDITIAGKKPVRFPHSTHLELGLDCGSCHHDGNHQPRTAEDIGGLVSVDQLRCVSCHNDDFQNKELQKEKDIFHARCKECHAQGINGKKGPTKCSDCHIKKNKAVEGC